MGARPTSCRGERKPRREGYPRMPRGDHRRLSAQESGPAAGTVRDGTVEHHRAPGFTASSVGPVDADAAAAVLDARMTRVVVGVEAAIADPDEAGAAQLAALAHELLAEAADHARLVRHTVAAAAHAGVAAVLAPEPL